MTGKKPIGTRWVDVNKGDEDNPEYRSRLVAKEINTGKMEGIFAATPPLEAKKCLLSMAMTEGIGYKRGHKPRGMKLDFIDVRRAYFYAEAARNIYIDLPEEDYEEGKVGKLRKSMYGTRDAAQNWEMEYSGFMKEIGFRQGKSTPCVFRHEARNLRVVVHGDDFTVLGHTSDLDWFRAQIKGKYEVKFRGRLGPEENDDKSIRILNRIVEWTREGIRYEADQRHAELIVKEMGFQEGSKSVTTPGSKNEKEDEGGEEEMDNQESTRYRAIVARAVYLAQDRTDIGFATKELARKMSKPRVKDWASLKRMARYLIGRERSVVRYDYQDAQDTVEVWVDTDYAGCKETRKSTSGGVMMIGGHTVKGWSNTQSVIALSSGEAEYYGMVKGTSSGMGLRSLMKDMDVDINIRVRTDSSAALGVSRRRGLGKLRHIELSQLWLQERVSAGDVQVMKVKGIDNLADALTKHVTQEEISMHMHGTAQEHAQGRHALAPEVAQDCAQDD